MGKGKGGGGKSTDPTCDGTGRKRAIERRKRRKEREGRGRGVLDYTLTHHITEDGNRLVCMREGVDQESMEGWHFSQELELREESMGMIYDNKLVRKMCENL